MLNRIATIGGRFAAAALFAFAGSGCSDGADVVDPAAYSFRLRQEPATARWYKGNTHTHTRMSDGDTPPLDVARWYKSNGYDFLVLSDHNVFTDPANLSAVVDSTFLLIGGEELTAAFDRTPVHVNGLNLRAVVPPVTGPTLLQTLQGNVDAVRAAAGVPHINHPNLLPALDAWVLAGVRNLRLFEIFNGHPLANNDGSFTQPSMEAVWDKLLTDGHEIYGIAVDDAHHFATFGPDRSNPGRGWIAIRASRLEPVELMMRLEAGSFYASTGVTVDAIELRSNELVIQIRGGADERFRTDFIGAGGELLGRSHTNPARYQLRGRERYVRAKVFDGSGRVAWTQPAFVDRIR